MLPAAAACVLVRVAVHIDLTLLLSVAERCRFWLEVDSSDASRAIDPSISRGDVRARDAIGRCRRCARCGASFAWLPFDLHLVCA